MDVTPISIGIEIFGGKLEVVIPRCSAVPCKETKTFCTAVDYQETATIPVLEGEMTMARANHILGEFMVTGLPKKPQGEVSVELTMNIDSNGILSVIARETSKGNEGSLTVVTDKNRLKQEEINQMIMNSMRYKAVEEVDQATKRAANNLKTLIDEARLKFDEITHKMSPSDQSTMKTYIDKVLEWLNANKKGEV